MDFRRECLRLKSFPDSTLTVSCRYQKVSEQRGNYLATIGTFTTIFEGRLLPDNPTEECFYTKNEIENMDLDVLEVIKVEDKYKGFQEFMQMAIRWGAKFDDVTRFPYTHEERIKIANGFLKKIRKIPYVSSAKVVGSVSEGSDGPISDIDIVITTTKCPGEEKCKIAKLMGCYILDPLDLWCSPQE